MLKIENLEVEVENKRIINNLDLTIEDGEIHVLMGPNGVGKSTLSRVIMGDSNYKVLNGSNLSTFSFKNSFSILTPFRLYNCWAIEFIRSIASSLASSSPILSPVPK